MKYRFDGKEKRVAFGVYPDVSLAQARERCGEARKHLANRIHPGVMKQVSKAATENSFKAVAREWHIKFSSGWVAHHADQIIRRLEREVFPWLGSRPIRDVNAPELLTVLRRIEARGALDTAHRVHQNCGKVFRHSVATGRAQRDPSGDLRGAIPPAQEHHHPTITEPKQVGELLRAITGYSGSHITRGALHPSCGSFTH